MKNSREPVSFIATDKPDEARTFFADILGLELCEASPFALVFLDGRHMLRIQIIPEFQPVDHTVHGWQVLDIVQDVEMLRAKGVRFKHFDHITQDALGIWTTPDRNKVAWFTDPSGNVLSLTEFA